MDVAEELEGSHDFARDHHGGDTDDGKRRVAQRLEQHPYELREILERSGLAIIETDLVGVELPEGPQPLLRVCTALLQAEVNIVQAFPLLLRPHDRPAVALMVDNIDMGLETLDHKGFDILGEADLADLH